MPEIKVSELAAAGATVGTEELAATQSGSSKKIKSRDIAKFGYQDVITEATSARTLSATDRGAWLRFTVASSYTVPTNTTFAASVGESFNGVQAGTGQVTFVAASGVTINKPTGYSLKTRAQGSPWCLIKVATNEWDLVGDLEAI